MTQPRTFDRSALIAVSPLERVRCESMESDQLSAERRAVVDRNGFVDSRAVTPTLGLEERTPRRTGLRCPERFESNDLPRRFTSPRNAILACSPLRPLRSEGQVHAQAVDERVVLGDRAGARAEPLNVRGDVQPGGRLVVVEKFHAGPVLRA